MRYAEERSEQERRESAYRIYISKCLQVVANNTSGNAERMALSKSFDEFLLVFGKPQPRAKTGEEIALETVSKLGLHFED